MTTRPPDLPEFDDPPVTEVALGIQFGTLEKFKATHLGLLWGLFRAEFPKITEQSQIPPIFETFGTSPAPSVAIKLMQRPEVPRVWFLDEEAVELIQFQPDRFLHNWRKVESKKPYPRYEAIKKRFLSEFDTLTAFLKENELGEIQPNQCEVTYVNHILSNEGEDLCVDLHRVFGPWGGVSGLESLGRFEGAGIRANFVIQSSDGEPIGRLHVTANPERSDDGVQMVQLTLVARGRPEKPTLDAASRFLDIGRDSIVRGFTALTTEEMHARWKRKK